MRRGDAAAHPFDQSGIRNPELDEHYWRDVGTLDAYWKANIDLCDVAPQLDLYDRDWPIWTHAEITPPAKFVHDYEGRRGSAVNSLVSGSGFQMARSVMSRVGPLVLMPSRSR